MNKTLIKVDDESFIQNVLTPKGIQETISTCKQYAFDAFQKKQLHAHIVILKPEFQVVPAPFTREDDVQVAICINVNNGGTMDVISVFVFDAYSLKYDEVMAEVLEIQSKEFLN